MRAGPTSTFTVHCHLSWVVGNLASALGVRGCFRLARALSSFEGSFSRATWAWVRVRGKCEEAMRELLGAGRGVQAGEVETPAMAAEARRAKRDEAGSRER